MLLKSLLPLLPYLKKYRRSYVVGTICVFCNNGIWILFPQVIRRAVDDMHLGVTRHKLATYALLLLAVAATKGIFPAWVKRSRSSTSPARRTTR